MHFNLSVLRILFPDGFVLPLRWTILFSSVFIYIWVIEVFILFIPFILFLAWLTRILLHLAPLFFIIYGGCRALTI